MRNDSCGGREGRFNYGMFQVITDSNNYLQLLCTFSFHAGNYYVIMWIIQFALNTWTVAEREKGEEGKPRKIVEHWGGGGHEWRFFVLFFFKRRTVVLLSSPLPFNSHWPVVTGWLKRSAAKSHQQTQQRGLNTCRQSPCVVRGEKLWAVRDLKSVEFMRLSCFKLLTSIFKFIVDSATDNLIHSHECCSRSALE